MNIKEEVDVEQYLAYFESILFIFRKHGRLELTQLVIFSFLEKQKLTIERELYDKRSRYNKLARIFSVETGNFDNFKRSLFYILNIVDLLIKKEYLYREKQYLKVSNKIIHDIKEETLLDQAFEESKRYSEEQLWKEFLYYV